MIDTSRKSVQHISTRSIGRDVATTWLMMLLVGIITFTLRAINLGRSFDIFVDEITYLRISENVANALHVTLYGKTFYLHPPVFFFLEAAYLKLFAPVGSTIDLIYAVRYLNVALASLSAIALFVLGRSIAGWWAGLAAASIFALDPFIVRMNSRNLLETAAIWWVLAGYVLLITALPKEQPRVRDRRSFWPFHWAAEDTTVQGRALAAAAPIALWRVTLAGICFGLALLTKDMTAFLTLLPLGMAWVFKAPLRRSVAGLTAGITCLTYLPYPLIVAIVGDWDRFAAQKFRGVLRLAGVVKETGLNRTTGPSFLETVVSRLDRFATTYVLIAAGIVAIVLLVLLGGKASRLLALWTGSAYALLGYCIVIGTLEEQFFYFLVIPALLATSVATALVLSTYGVPRIAHKVVRTGAAVFIIVFVGWSGSHWLRTHLTPDNGYEQLLTYLQQNVPLDADVAATSETAQFLLDDYASGPWGSWTTVDQLLTHRPDYLLISSRQLEWDHGADAQQLLAWVEQHGRRVYSYTDRESDGPLILYQLDLR